MSMIDFKLYCSLVPVSMAGYISEKIILVRVLKVPNHHLLINPQCATAVLAANG